MDSTHKRRIILWVVVGAATVLALVYAFWPRGILVDTVKISRGPMMVTLDEEGETRIHDIYTVSAPVSGEITRVEVQAGDPVRANETVLALIRPLATGLMDMRTVAEREGQANAAEAAVGAATANVVAARTRLDLAKSDLARGRQLRQQHAISQQDLDRLQNDLNVRTAEVAAAVAALNASKADRKAAMASLIRPGKRGEAADYVQIKAPVDGRVLRVLHKSEGVVAASEPLIDIGDAKKLDAIVDYLSTDAVQIHAGDPVLIDDWGGGHELKGRVERVEPFGFTKVSALGIEEQRVNVIIDFDSPLKARAQLGHGYRIESRVIIWQANDVLKVPLGATFREGGKWAVFLVKNGRARLTGIEVGHMNSTDAEVLHGLNAGDTVILHPSDQIHDDVRVTH